MTETAVEIAELEQQIKVLRQQERESEKAALAAFVPAYAYSISRATTYGDRYFHEEYVVYRVDATVTNGDAAPAGFKPFEGHGAYLYNALACHFVQSLSGNMHLPTPGFGAHQDVDWPQVYGELSAYVMENPDGGDITDIVLRMRAAVGK
jgi:hypothetical protein